MNRFKVILTGAFLLAMVMGQVGWAQDKAVVKPLSAEQIVELAKPYISSTTLAVAYTDTKRLDFVGLAAWINQLMPKLKLPKEITQEQEFKAGVIMGPMMAEGMRSGFIAAGGRHIVLVFNVPETFREPTPIIIFPIEKGGNAETIASILQVPTLNNKMKANKVCVVLHQDAVLFGNAQDLRQIVAGKYKSDSRPELLKAFKEVEGQQIQGVVNPYKDMRRVVDELMPNLPAQLGAEPTSTFTRGLRWTSIGINLSAKPEIKLVNQSDSQIDAMALYRFLKRIPTLVEPNTPPSEKFLLEWIKQGVSLVPKPVDSVMQTTLTTEQVEQNIAKVILPMIAKARAVAQHAQTMSQIRSLVIACVMYASEHKEQWPTSLEQAVEGQKGTAKLLVNPRALSKSRKFIYRRPKKLSGLTDYTTRIIIYEDYDTWPTGGVVVGCADGHSETIRTEKEFKKRLGPKVKKDEQELSKAQAKALRTKTLGDIRNVAVACNVYAADTEQWPTSLEQVKKMFGDDKKMLINSRVISKSRGFVYIKPTVSMQEIKNSSEVIMIYEDYDTWPTGGIGACYVDSHGEIIRTEKELKKRLSIKAKKK